MVMLYVCPQICCISAVWQFTMAQSTNTLFLLYDTTGALIEPKILPHRALSTVILHERDGTVGCHFDMFTHMRIIDCIDASII